MGAGWGLIQGLTQGMTGAQQGIQDRKKLEQQAMHQMLADSLLKAQIGDVQAQTEDRRAQAFQRSHPKPTTYHTTDKKTGAVFQHTQGPEGTWSTEMLSPGEEPGIPDTEWGAWVKHHPEFRDTPRVARQKVVESYSGSLGKAETKSPTQKALTINEKESYAAAKEAKRIIGVMRDLHKRDPQASQTPMMASIMGIPGQLPFGIGKAVSPLTEPMVQSRLLPKQAAYKTNANQLLHFTSSILAKGGRSFPLLKNLQDSYTSAVNTSDPEAAQKALNNLENYIDDVLSNDPRLGTKPKAAGDVQDVPDDPFADHPWSKK